MKKVQKKKISESRKLDGIVDFIFEAGILAKTPRSGFHFLGSGEQSVAEHTSRVMYIGYVLSQMDKKLDTTKVLLMCLLHDLTEARVSDLNYVHQKYVVAKGDEAIEDLAKTVPFGENLKEVVGEYEKRKSKESIVAKDADNLEWIVSLKEQYDTGNIKAMDWIKPAVQRLKTKDAKNIAKEIMKTNSDRWWFSDKKNEWWVNRNKK